MATAAPAQNYDNHRKFVPGFHAVAFGILAINFFTRCTWPSRLSPWIQSSHFSWPSD